MALLYSTILKTTFSQETFLKIYPSQEDKDIYNVFETNDGHFIFSGRILLNNSSYDRTGTMSKITSSGELVDSKNYNYSNGNSLYAELANTSTSGLYYLLGSQDSVSNNQVFSKVFLKTIDNDMNTISITEYGTWTDYNNIACDFEVLGDSIAYILSILIHENTGKYNYLLIRADLVNGNYNYFIPNDNLFKAATGFIIDQTNELVKVNYRIFGDDYTMWPWNPVANISYNLENVEIVLLQNDFFSQTKIADKTDSTYLLSAAFYDLNNGQRDLGIAEYNKQDSLLSQVKFPGGIDSTTYPGAGRNNILITSDYIWVMGWYNCLTSMSLCTNEPTYIMLNKLTHNLELIEQLFYGGEGVYVPKDIIETNDNHIVVAGDFFDPYAVPFNCHFDPFILKVNSEGLIVNTQNHELPQVHEAIVVPNPGKEILAVKLAIQHHAAVLQLFDIRGRLLLTEHINTDMQQINTSALPAGIYPYRITAGNRIIGWGKWVKE